VDLDLDTGKFGIGHFVGLMPFKAQENAGGRST